MIGELFGRLVKFFTRDKNKLGRVRVKTHNEDAKNSVGTTYKRIRYRPQMEVYLIDWWIIRLFKRWATFYDDNGKVKEFPTAKKAKAWLKREIKREYRDYNGVIRVG